MNFWDYTLPWKAIPNMAKDVKKAWSGKGKDRHDSFLGAIGKYADPGGALLGDKWMDFWHGTVPREVNRALEPVGKFHRDNLDPIYMLGGKNTDLGRSITDMGVNKGGDWSALITGAVLGGGALAGGAGAQSGGAAGGAGGLSPYGPYASGYQFAPGSGFGGGGAGGAGGAAPAGMNWSDPNTYMRMAGNMQGQQPPQQNPQDQQQKMLEEMERRRREREMRQQAMRLAEAMQQAEMMRLRA